ncbi:MAG: VOC family protein [Propionibacteriaceae bacterium]|nr:VOC family protein [Propionibacteriaceae bacterium]
MTARVISLGYIRFGATSLSDWTDFAENVLGLQAVPAGEGRLLLRNDHHDYRLDIRQADEPGVQALGWEVRSQTDLDTIVERLESAGYAVEQLDEAATAERMVSAAVKLRDPDDKFDLELFWGLHSATDRFVSPLGASFVADNLGLGHIFQVVSDAARTEELYFDIFGFRLSDHIDFGGGVVGTFTHCNPRHHTFAFAENPKRPLGVGHFMLEVTELDIIGRAMDRIDDEKIPLIRHFGKHTNDKMVSLYVVTPSNVGLEFGTGGIRIDDATWRPVRYDEAHYWGHQPV